MSLKTLPDELIYEIVNFLQSQKDYFSLMYTCKDLQEFNTTVYELENIEFNVYLKYFLRHNYKLKHNFTMKVKNIKLCFGYQNPKLVYNKCKFIFPNFTGLNISNGKLNFMFHMSIILVLFGLIIFFCVLLKCFKQI